MTAKLLCFALLLVISTVMLSGCGSTPCNGTSLTTGGSTTGGNVNTGGNVCGSGATSGGSGNGQATAFAFYLDGTVETASLSTTGSLKTLTNITPPLQSGAASDDMIVVKSKFLYVPYADLNGVQGLVINKSSGALTAIPGSPFMLQSSAGTDAVVSDPQGRFLFVGDETNGTGSISVFAINSTTGALTEAPGSPFFTFGVSEVDSMAVDGTGKYLYAAQGSIFFPVLAFSIDQNTGALAAVPGSPFSLNVAQIHADPSGKFLLGVQEIQDSPGSATDQHIYVFAIDQTTGAPIAPGTAFSTVGAPFDFAISPNGKFVYVTENDLSGTVTSIEGFQLDATTGNLSALPGSPFTTLPTATQCKFDEGGGLLFCATNGSSSLSVFTANTSTGGLTHTVTDLSAPVFPFAVTD